MRALTVLISLFFRRLFPIFSSCVIEFQARPEEQVPIGADASRLDRFPRSGHKKGVLHFAATKRNGQPLFEQGRFRPDIERQLKLLSCPIRISAFVKDAALEIDATLLGI
jgi:hypothetical protein